MRVLIAEDEQAAVQRLKRLLAGLAIPVEVVGVVDTVTAALDWFREHEAPDVALFDVQLADGDSFEIFRRTEVPCPVIFTTAFDRHALKAFRVNAVDYLLKPVRVDELAQAMDRVGRGSALRDLGALGRPEAAERTVAPVRRFLIRYGDQFKVVEPADIAYFHSLQKNTFLRTRTGRDLPMDESLDKLEGQLDPLRFTRLNRQIIVQVDSIRELLAYSKSRVKVLLDPHYDEDAIVSSERTASFKRWLAGGPA